MAPPSPPASPSGYSSQASFDPFPSESAPSSDDVASRPNADIEQQVNQADPQERLPIEVPEEVVKVSDESRGKVDESRGKGPAISPPAAPLSRKRKAVYIHEALPEIPAVLHLTLPDHAPAIARYLDATRSAADGDYYAALTHEERYNRFAYHATHVDLILSYLLIFPYLFCKNKLRQFLFACFLSVEFIGGSIFWI